jgi:hypothetical protein
MALVNVSNLPFTGPRLGHLTGGMTFLDLRLYYSAKAAWTTISAYGPQGRRACLGFYATWDMAIPLLAMAFTTVALATTWNLEGRKRYLLLAPLAALGLDLLENLALATMILMFPATPRLLGGAAGVFTFLKWLAYGISAGAVLTGFVKRLWDHGCTWP